MFDELMRQAKRLFSSSTNGGSLVAKWTDILHKLTLVVVMIAFVVLLSFGHFRADFECQGTHGISGSKLTNFCYANGTTTVISLNESTTKHREVTPHVGHHFATNNRDYLVISHSYISQLWYIVLTVGVLSFIATRDWAKTFQHAVLQAVLRLVSSKESELVRAAQEAKLYEMLTDKLKNRRAAEHRATVEGPEFASMPKHEQALRRIEQLQTIDNVHDNLLNYYPNQIVYLLMSRDTTKYKMSSMNLRRRLITSALISFTCAALQYVVPLYFIGPEYKYYGLNWLRSLVHHLIISFVDERQLAAINSFDYKLSESIFPISTQCQYVSYGDTGMLERINVQCTANVNKTFAPMFAIFWWLAVVTFLVSACTLFQLIICSLSIQTMGNWYWPNATKQADQVATFRYRKDKFEKKHDNVGKFLAQTEPNSRRQISSRDCNNNNNSSNNTCTAINMNSYNNRPETVHLGQKPYSPEDCKRMEAEEEDAYDKLSKPWCKVSRLLKLPIQILRWLSKKLRPSGEHKRRLKLEREPKYDINIYYMFYLLNLRLENSKSKTEEVIMMTAEALEEVLCGLSEGNRISRTQLTCLQEQAIQQHTEQARSDVDQTSLSYQSQSSHQLVVPIVDETTT